MVWKCTAGYYYFGAEASDSGIATARERFNTTTYLSLYGNVFNGTSSREMKRHDQKKYGSYDFLPGGITPITDKFNNWTRVEAIQQGFTADVNCAVTQAVSDPVFRVNQTTIASVITRIYLCCNCTSINTEGEGWLFSLGSLLSTELSIRLSNIHPSDFKLYRFYCLPDK